MESLKLQKENTVMAQYKTVQVPGINIDHTSNQQDAVKQFQNVIEKEASGGWELVCSHTITVSQDPEPLPDSGCLGGLLMLIGLKQRPEPPRVKTYHIDMLIFIKK